MDFVAKERTGRENTDSEERGKMQSGYPVLEVIEKEMDTGGKAGSGE